MEQVHEIANRSLVNCHAVGVDSLLFEDVSEKRLRVFIAHKHHELWRNSLPFESELSIAIHPHHCDVKLIPIFGDVYNIVEREHGGHRCTVQPFRYESAITGEAGKFTKLRSPLVLRLGMDLISGAWFMPANQIHTVYVPKGQSAAWWVCEGKEDVSYKPICFSNSDLEKFNFAPLYLPMSVERAKELMFMLRNSPILHDGSVIDKAVEQVKLAEKRSQQA